ncbi:Sphingomyelin synthase-like domain-containing protein [Entamoeba marina]
MDNTNSKSELTNLKDSTPTDCMDVKSSNVITGSNIIVLPSSDIACCPPCGLYGGIKDTLLFIFQCLKFIVHHPLQSIYVGLTHPLFASILFILISGNLNGVVIGFAQEYQRIWYRQHPDIEFQKFILDDFGFTTFPFVDIVSFADIYLGVIVILCIGARFFITPYRLVVLRRFLTMMGTIFSVRVICLYATLIPDPSRTQSTVEFNPFFEGFFISTGLHMSTVDKIFSGHTMSVTLCALFWIHYCGRAPIFDFNPFNISKKTTYGYPLRFTIASFYIMCYVAVAWCLFVMLRRHYSVDVFIAIILSVVIFKTYHNYILTSCTRKNSFNAFIMWLEQDAPDIPHEMYLLKEPIVINELTDLEEIIAGSLDTTAKDSQIQKTDTNAPTNNFNPIYCGDKCNGKDLKAVGSPVNSLKEVKLKSSSESTKIDIVSENEPKNSLSKE